MSRIREEELRLLKIASALEESPYEELFDIPEGTRSSYMAKEETGYITDYGFETPMEFIRLLTDSWTGEACRKELLAAAPCIAAAVFKQEPDNAPEGGKETGSKAAMEAAMKTAMEAAMEAAIEVPMFIYNF